MLFVGTSIIHPSTEGVFLLCNILDLLIYRTHFEKVGGRMQAKVNTKNFIRYDEGAERYSMSKHSFMKLAQDARAVYKINRITLVNVKIFEEYLESFRA